MAWYIVNSTDAGNNIDLTFVTPSNVYARLTSDGDLKVDAIKNMEFLEESNTMSLTTTQYISNEFEESESLTVAMRAINNNTTVKQEIVEIEWQN